MKCVGGIGHIAAFNFYPGKNLGAYGEGGIVTTNNADYAEHIRLLLDWGQRQKYHHEVLAYNYRMDAILGAILRVKLTWIEDWTEQRRAHARHYSARLANSGIPGCVELADRRHVYHIYSVFHPERQQLQIALQKLGIQSRMHYPIPVNQQGCYRELGYRDGDLPVTEKIAHEQQSLPMFAELSEEQVDQVCDAVCKWAG